MSGIFQFNEKLEKTSLAEMLQTIYRHKVPGLIELSRQGVVKRIYVENGVVFHARSSDRNDRLGPFLYRSGLLGREDLKKSMHERAISGKRHGEVLIEAGLMSPAAMADAIRGHMEEIVWSVFSWQEGQVSFKIGGFEDSMMLKIHLPLRRVILRGIIQAPDTKSLVAKLGTKTTAFAPCFSTEDLIEIALDQDEYNLLRLVDGKRQLYDICDAGPFSMSENARRMYAFHVLRLIERVDAKRIQKSGAFKIRVADRSSRVELD